MRERPTALLLGGAVAAALLSGACTEEPVTTPAPEDAPGATSPTVELILSASQMVSWRDTTYTGYAVPAEAPFLVLANGAGVEARSLVRYRAVAESVSLDDQDFEVTEFPEAELRIAVDTIRSDARGPFTIRAFPLTRGYSQEDAGWTQAREGEAWSTPGGDLGPLLGSHTQTVVTDSAIADTMILSFGSSSDSLLKSWRQNDGEPGAALTLEGDARLHVVSARLRYEARPSDQDTTLTLEAGTRLQFIPSTFIYDPAPPPPGTDLRLGGLPASRIYFSFQPPDEVGGLQLKGATISRAELVFQPRAPPAGDLALDAEVTSRLERLLDDPLDVGPKTPLVSSGGLRQFTTRPGSLADGKALRVGIDTTLMRRWSEAPADSFTTFEMGLRLTPEAQALGFWDFYSEEAPVALEPVLRLLVTPPVDFQVP